MRCIAYLLGLSLHAQAKGNDCSEEGVHDSGY